jgi:outer membrane protein OmpA-like peptidoglycan-associated protein
MQIKTTVLSSLTIALLSGGMSHAQAAEAPYYNPANSASQTGKTVGYELYKTIGCPGRGILDAPCAGPAPAAPAAPMPQPMAEKSAPTPLSVDSDGDGVPDDKDRCPGTPKGAKVDAQGCELDGDQDGVVDRLDQCPTTPPGRKVNAEGCELDGDGDGVVDALDQCPTTPPGRKVNAEGCELDGDGDGVVDALDRCPTTPPGRKVNAEGCELDSDGDGILDIADQCPDTPAGDRVDSKGCSLPKVMNLQGVNFDDNKDALRPDAAAILDDAVATLKRYPGLKVEIAGHTDSRNSDAYNLELSQRRAETVLNYFVSQGIEADRLAARGYGEAEPIADNGTRDGRFKNRRVELRSLD